LPVSYKNKCNDILMLSKNQIKFIKSLSLKKNRVQYQLFTVEGVKGITEFLKSDFAYEGIYTTNDRLFSAYNPVVITAKDLTRISQLKTPNQALAVFKMPIERAIDSARLLVGLDAVQDPGNLGTIIRLCDWFGVQTLLCSKDTVDCFNSKVVQASMGSLARVHLHYVDLAEFLKTYTGKVYGTFMTGATLYETAFQEEALLLMGNEANGISEDLQELIHERITIPQYGQLEATESLNVATATAICLAEMRRAI